MEGERYTDVIWTSVTFEKTRGKEDSFNSVIHLTRHCAGGQ